MAAAPLRLPTALSRIAVDSFWIEARSFWEVASTQPCVGLELDFT
jgi:hypothetical protein